MPSLGDLLPFPSLPSYAFSNTKSSMDAPATRLTCLYRYSSPRLHVSRACTAFALLHVNLVQADLSHFRIGEAAGGRATVLTEELRLDVTHGSRLANAAVLTKALVGCVPLSHLSR